MNIKIEFRYAVLTSLCVLLWLVIEYAAGFQDTYIAWYPYVSMLVFIIPVVTYRMALKEKIEQKFGKLSFNQAFMSALVLTIFATILAVPIQLMFHKLVNPGFFETMILYSAQNGKTSVEQARHFFNLQSYIFETTIITFFFGIVLSLILAFRMRTIK